MYKILLYLIIDNIMMIYKLRLTINDISACSILNVMKVVKLIIRLYFQSFDVKLCAVAIDG